jgi:hypothetical protein
VLLPGEWCNCDEERDKKTSIFDFPANFQKDDFFARCSNILTSNPTTELQIVAVSSYIACSIHTLTQNVLDTFTGESRNELDWSLVTIQGKIRSIDLLLTHSMC